ncbi:hypothetical protein N2152v2_008964 [Parachlorella kessleri]
MKPGLDDFDLFMKIILVGDSGVGKTNILSRSVRNEFDQNSRATIGVEFATKTLTLEGQVVKAQIWDTAGQERYSSITRAFYRGAVGAMLVYDVTRRSTFESVKRWLSSLREHAGSNIVVMLVGNKIDLAHLRDVTTEQGKAVAEKERLLFMETSAADGSNIEPAFIQEITEIFQSMKGRSRLQSQDQSGPAVPVGVRIPVGGGSNKASSQGGCCS